MSSLVSNVYTNVCVGYSNIHSNKEETPMEKNWIVYSPNYGLCSFKHKSADEAWASAKKFAGTTKREDIQVYESLGYVKQPIPEFETVKF